MEEFREILEDETLMKSILFVGLSWIVLTVLIVGMTTHLLTSKETKKPNKKPKHPKPGKVVIMILFLMLIELMTLQLADSAYPPDGSQSFGAIILFGIMIIATIFTGILLEDSDDNNK